MDLEDAELLQMERDAATLRLAADRIAKQLAMLQPKLAEAEKREARDAIVLRAGDVTAIGADSNTRIAKQYPDLLRRIVKSFLLLWSMWRIRPNSTCSRWCSAKGNKTWTRPELMSWKASRSYRCMDCFSASASPATSAESAARRSMDDGKSLGGTMATISVRPLVGRTQRPDASGRSLLQHRPHVPARAAARRSEADL